MNTSINKQNNRWFEASYSIQLSYGRVKQQLAKFIALIIDIRNEMRSASLSLNSTHYTRISPIELWEICGLSPVSCLCPDCFEEFLNERGAA